MRRLRSPLTRYATLAAATLGLGWGARRLGRRFGRVAVAGESMAPALRPGDFLVLRRAGEGWTPRFGQIVQLPQPRSGRPLLKRVVGLPGEMLRVGEGVEVNGRALEEPYASGSPERQQYRGVQRLGPGEVFVLGDRRSASTDSRDFGPVSSARIEAVAVACYWPPSRARLLRAPRRQFRPDVPDVLDR